MSDTADMTKLDDIKAAIAALPDEQKTALERWLDEVDADIFDRKIERDAASGKLDKLAAKADASYKAGRRTPL